MKKLSLLFASAALLMAQPLAAQYTLNVRDADVRAFVEDAARVTGKTFILDSRVQGKISVVSDRPLSRSEYFEVFLATLRANGLVAIPLQGGGYRIQQAEGAASQPGKIGSNNAAASQFVTEVFRLRSIDASAAVETLRPLISREGSITANRNANSLVVADYADNIRRIRSLIRQIDRDSAATQIVPLDNAGAREIATSLQTLAGQGVAGEGARAPVTIVAIDSSNSIALRGDPGAVSRFAEMARQLDARAESGAEIRVYRLKHANAETLLPTIETLIGSKQSSSAADSAPAPATPGTAPAPGTQAAAPASLSIGSSGNGGIVGRGPVVVTRYEGVNALIVAANPDMQRMLGELIRQIDTRPEQVLVEAIVVEIGNDAARQLGVQFLIGGKNAPFAASAFSTSQPNILTIGGAVAAEELSRQTTTVNGTTTVTSTSSSLGDSLQQAAAASILNATGGFGGVALDIGKDAIFGSIINAVSQDTESNLLATPYVVTLNNQPSKFLVGQEVPITTGEALSDNFDNAFRTVQRQEVGIKLEVTPQVNDEGDVKLFLRQEVSSVAGPVSSRSSDLIINKREFETTLTVGDGQILAIGGLLNDDERRTIEKIPLLGDIPIIGELFKSRSRSRRKTNLMVFIRPTILRSRADGDAVTAQRYGYIRQQQYLLNPKREPALDELVRDYMGAQPPVAPVAAQGDVVIPPSSPDQLRQPADTGPPIRSVPLPESEALAMTDLPDPNGRDSLAGDNGPGDDDIAMLDPPASAAVSAAAQSPLVDLPYNYARRFGYILEDQAENGERMRVLMREGADPAILLEIRRYVALPLDTEIIGNAEFDRHLSDHYAMDGSALAMADDLHGAGGQEDLLSLDIPSADDLLDSVDDAPVIRLINAIIAQAVRQGVSDIHIEPYETGLVVRMRRDGVLEEKLRMPAHVSPVVVSRIKVMARLDIAERRIPQDGRISITLGGKLVDVRVSTLPSRAGERVVMRILDKDNAFIALDLLGMSDDSLEILRSALAEPNGVILVTGPTGSGKTTTLYAGLKQLNDGSRNILTVEDPVEYAVDGVGQTQVNAKVGMTFAAGLRAILRQDPDVVMVGEIRDRETAEIAIQAALTGHLVLSTVHTNDAVGAITRLRDMRIEPFLLASTLRAVIAQRLVRRLCPDCRKPVQAEKGTTSLLGLESGTVVRVPVGCEACNNTGFQGRIGVFEVVRVDETIRRIINEGGDEAMIARHAFVNRPNLASAARKLMLAGEITLEDAIRVTRQEQPDNG